MRCRLRSAPGGREAAVALPIRQSRSFPSLRTKGLRIRVRVSSNPNHNPNPNPTEGSEAQGVGLGGRGGGRGGIRDEGRGSVRG